MISNAVREAVRARIDIAELIGQYVPLRRSGKDLKACCPFHQEKTPSFQVSRERGLFHCFGCKASGDLFTFYQRIEGVDFPEALRILAERANVQIEEEVRDPARVAEERRAKELTERLYFACEVATQFFERCLDEAEYSDMARDAIVERGVDREMAAKFRIGYAPATWESLTEELKRREVSPADAELAGLLMPSKHAGRFYDRFRHRLMFPIWDRHGKVVAFSGRVLPTTEDMQEGIVPEDAGKYINSPETPLFKKSEALFGLHVARPAMRQKAEAILVEGNFDVVTMHQHGFGETVAPLGTAFTEAQAKLLRRSAETVTILFDADNAGRKAIRAALSAFTKAGLVAKVVALPRDRGKDPDEVLRSPGGPEFMKERIEHARDLLEWFIDDTAAQCGDTTPERVAGLRQVAPMLLQITDQLTRASYIDCVMRALHFPEKQVQMALREAEQAAREEGHNPFHGKPKAPKAPRDEPFRRTNPENEEQRDSVSAAKADAVTALLRCPAMFAEPVIDELLELLDEGFARALVEAARVQFQERGELDGGVLLTLAPNEKARTWLAERVVVEPEAPDGAGAELQRQALRECVARLRAQRDAEIAKRLRQESARARASGDDERAAELLRQAQQYDRQRQNAANNKNRGAA